jgi:hypothetical protein
VTKEVKEFDNLTDLIGWVGENWDNIQEYKEFAEQEDMVELTMCNGKKLVVTF